jgi:hypothetical protein
LGVAERVFGVISKLTDEYEKGMHANPAKVSKELNNTNPKNAYLTPRMLACNFERKFLRSINISSP